MFLRAHDMQYSLKGGTLLDIHLSWIEEQEAKWLIPEKSRGLSEDILWMQGYV